VWNCFIFFLGEYSSVWPDFFRVLSQIMLRFLRAISGKNYFGRTFHKFCANQDYHLPKLVKFRPTFCNFFSWYLLRWKISRKITQVLSYVVCTQLRRQVHEIITKRRYGEEKSGRFDFGKPVSFTLSLGLTTPYSLGLLVWNFYQTFVIVCVEFWLSFEPRIQPTRFAISFY